MIAIREAYKAGLFSVKSIKSNIVAGFIVGIVALPLAMAFAIASGVNPEQGIYTAIIAGLIVGVFGGSRVQISGPTGAFVVILSAITARYGVAGLQVATMMAGGMLLMMSFLKIGNAIKFIPYPVIVGFTSGIGVIIFVGQIKDFLGLPVAIPLDAPFYKKVSIIFGSLHRSDVNTTFLSLISLVLLIMVPRYIRLIPAPLVAIVVATVTQWIFALRHVATIGSVFGGIPQTLPHFGFPSIDVHSLPLLIGPAFTIALLGAIESLLSASAADSVAGTRHDANSELLGQGLANVIAPLWGGFASTGAIARTITNVRHGGTSPVAAIVHAITLVLIVVFFAPYAAHIPFAALAAILMVVAYRMSDVPEFVHLVKKAPWYDVAVLLGTFLLTMFTDLVIAVSFGVIMAMLLFVSRMVQATEVSKEIPSSGFSSVPEGVLVYHLEGPVFFGVAEKIEQALLMTGPEPTCVIFSMHHVPFIDITGLEMLSKIIKHYRKHKTHIYLCEANKRVEKKMITFGLVSLVTASKVFKSLDDVYASLSSDSPLIK